MTKFFSDETVASWFEYHVASSENVRMGHRFVRDKFRALAVELNNVLPEGPDKSVALRSLRAAMYDANAAIAVAQRLFEEE